MKIKHILISLFLTILFFAILIGVGALIYHTLLDPNGEKSATGKFYTYGYVMKAAERM